MNRLSSQEKETFLIWGFDLKAAQTLNTEADSGTKPVSTAMDLELVKFINSDLTWNAVKKRHRSMMRRPRKPAASNSAIKMQESVAFDYEKSGVAILGQHFGEEVVDVPIKKRILMLQSPSLSNEKARSTQPHSPSPHHEKQECHSMKSKLIEKEIPDLNDFFGIELLAAAACHTSVYDTPAPMESSAVEEHTTTRVVESYTDGVTVKDDIAPVDSDDSSVQDNTFPVIITTDNGNSEGDKASVPSKDVRLHWDLNTVMDEWEEPCCDILVDPHSEKGYLKDDDSQQVKSDAIDNKSEGIQAVSEVVQGGSCQDDKVSSEDRLSDCCGSNKVKAGGGYDSPVEDGELRDTWQKNEVEEMECVDYESDNIYEDNFDAIESVNNEVIETLPNNEIEQDDKKNIPSISNQIPEPSQSEEKGRTSSFGVHRSRSENFQDSYSRGKRDFGQEKSTGRDGASYHGWDSRNTQNHRYCNNRPKHVIGGYNQRSSSYKTFNTKPERNESYGVYSRERVKGGLGFHQQGSRRGEDYNGHDQERKVSSFSPSFTRGPHLSRSRRRSRSRSRSESPIAWNFQKKSKVDTKRERESPDHIHIHRADKYNSNINGESRDRNNLGRNGMKSSDHFYPNFSRSGRYPPQGSGQYDEKYGGRFRYYHKDNGFRYTRNENRYFKDPVGDGVE
uniref:Uncharacterized protein n=2 Tax=Lactuca sativa TaxID=4236 RepID=A0A9R1UKW0_LACSA|nr:hypothetical protein LSAT_V11C900479600 [Lactuca sativa]